MSGFKFDQNAINNAANEAVRDHAAKMQKVLDRCHRQYSGQAIETVRQRLSEMWRRELGESIDRKELDAFAEPISGGDRIVLKPGKVR